MGPALMTCFCYKNSIVPGNQGFKVIDWLGVVLSSSLRILPVGIWIVAFMDIIISNNQIKETET